MVREQRPKIFFWNGNQKAIELFGVDVLRDSEFELTLCFEHLGAV